MGTDIARLKRDILHVLSAVLKNLTLLFSSCRPLSKTVRFNVLKVTPQGSSAGSKMFSQ